MRLAFAFVVAGLFVFPATARAEEPCAAPVLTLAQLDQSSPSSTCQGDFEYTVATLENVREACYQQAWGDWDFWAYYFGDRCAREYTWGYDAAYIRKLQCQSMGGADGSRGPQLTLVQLNSGTQPQQRGCDHAREVREREAWTNRDECYDRAWGDWSFWTYYFGGSCERDYRFAVEASDVAWDQCYAGLLPVKQLKRFDVRRRAIAA